MYLTHSCYGLYLDVLLKSHAVMGGAFSKVAESGVRDAGIKGVLLLHQSTDRFGTALIPVA